MTKILFNDFLIPNLAFLDPNDPLRVAIEQGNELARITEQRDRLRNELRKAVNNSSWQDRCQSCLSSVESYSDKEIEEHADFLMDHDMTD